MDSNLVSNDTEPEFIVSLSVLARVSFKEVSERKIEQKKWK